MAMYRVRFFKLACKKNIQILSLLNMSLLLDSIIIKFSKRKYVPISNKNILFSKWMIKDPVIMTWMLKNMFRILWRIEKQISFS